MISYFLKHQWAQFRRSASFEREIGFAIFIWIIGIFVLFNLLVLAFYLPGVITEIPGVDDPISFFNLGLIYYFFAELLMRYFIQKVPALDIQPYLTLPIKRKYIANFLIGKSMISVFNVISMLLTIPFAIRILLPEFGTSGIMAWIGCIFLTSISIHFFNILFKKKLEDLPIVWTILVALVGGNYLLSKYYSIDIFEPLASGLQQSLMSPYLVLLPFGIMLSLLAITLKFFKDNLYLEEIGEKSNSSVEKYTEKLSFLGNSSLSNTLILQEIKMILRHKRTRSVIFLSLVFVGYGLIFFGEEKYVESPGMLLFLGVFMSGLFAINYGQFFWSWNTNQLDFFFTRPMAVHSWLKARYRLIVVATLITTMLCVPYVYFGWEALFLILAGSIYNIGINIPLMMRLSMWGPKPIDLNKGAFMNYQGTGAAQWLMAIPLMAGPYLVYLPLNALSGHLAGLAGVAAIGLLGYTLRDYFIGLIATKMQSVKYKLIKDLTL